MTCKQSLGVILLVIAWSVLMPTYAVTVTADFQQQQDFELYYTLDAHSIGELMQSKNRSKNWQKINSGNINLGLQSQPIWIKFSIDNQLPNSYDLILLVDNPLLDSTEVFHIQDNQLLLKQHIGDTLPLSNRQIKNESLLVSLSLPPLSQSDVYIKISNHAGIRAPISLWHPAEFLKHKSKFNLLYGLLVGFIFSLAITCFILYAFTRKSYFALVGVVQITLWLLLTYLYGFGYRYFHPNWPYLQQLAIPTLLLFTAGLFPFLHQQLCEAQNKRLTLLQKSFILGLVFIAACLWLLPLKITILVSLTLTPLIFSCLAVYSVRHFNKQLNQPNLAYLIALASFFIAIIYLDLVVLNLFSLKLGVISSLFICFLISSLSLSYAAMKLFLIQRDEQVISQQAELAQSKVQDTLLKERLALQEQAQLDLEANIEERTFELQVTLRELEEKNRELEQLNMEDPLTQTKNRRYFDKKIQMDLRRSRREQTPLSIIMLDIDRFKSINDNYGHLTGDQAIRAVANIIKQHLKRPLDEVARYGGEEFVVLLPSTPLFGALEIAEQIRLAVEKADIIVAGTKITFTISAGVYTAIASDIDNPSHYTECADKALYHAKQSGRNRTISFDSLD